MSDSHAPAREYRRPRRARLVAVLAVLAVAAAACGDDDDDDGAAADEATTASAAATTSSAAAAEATSTAPPATTTSTAEPRREPAQGGELTVLVTNLLRTFDAVAATGLYGNDGDAMFSAYGALIVYDPVRNEIIPVLAESFEPDGDDFTRWTLVLRDGLVFSDGTPFDSAAVMANWQRAQDPANASQAIGVASSITSMNTVDDVTLELQLRSPNAHFANTIARGTLTYIASPAAFGPDLTNQPVGAGPFLVESYVRDDRVVFTANPDWGGADGPYLDGLTIRVVTDEAQRTDTYITGDADMFTTTAPASVDRATAEREGTYTAIVVSGGGTYAFNNTVPPFDDVRVRRAVAVGVDAHLATEIQRPGADRRDQPAPRRLPLVHAGRGLPGVRPRRGAAAVRRARGGDRQPRRVRPRALPEHGERHLRGVPADESEPVRGRQRDHGRRGLRDRVPAGAAGQLPGAPLRVPGDVPRPRAVQPLHSGLPTNATRYTNPQVDALLDEARVDPDAEAQAESYEQALVLYVEDMPYWHTLHPSNGWVSTDEVGGVELYETGVLRTDLLHRTG